MKPLRILHVTDSAGVYGAESVILDLCTELRGMGQLPVIASIGDTHCDEKPIERAARERGFEIRAVRMEPGPNPRGAFTLLRLAKDEGADVIHTHGYKSNILLSFLPKRWRFAPLVMTVHGYTDVTMLDRMALYNRLDRLALRRADRVVLVHQGMAAKSGLSRPYDPRWRVIENGIHTGNPSESTGDLDPQILRLCEGRSLVIGAVGRLSREKGFDILVRAAAETLRRDERAVLLILGEGAERPALERLSARLGVADRVLMPGYRSRAKDYFPLFHLFVLPSLTEGLPITLLEAMHAGVPIVATRVGGVADVLDHGRGGVLVQPGDSRVLAEAIRRCVDDRAFASGLAEHSKIRSSAWFSSQAMAQRYLELYREVVSDLSQHRSCASGPPFECVDGVPSAAWARGRARGVRGPPARE